MKIRSCLLIIIIVLCSILLSGCNNANSVETKAYPIAIGIDISSSNKFKVTFQIAILNNSGNSSESSSKELSTIISVDCDTFDSGVSLLNSYISKKVDLSHCKAIIMSEELANNGVNEIVYSLANNIEIRPSCNIIVSRCNASDMLEQSKPIFESNPAKYYELILNSAEYTGYSPDLTLSDFYSNILSTTSQATAILGGINVEETHLDNSNSNFKGDNYKADDSPISNKNKLEVMGIAVFHGDKLVGELSNLETICHLIVTNNLESATITIPNPFTFNTPLSVYINLSKSTDNDVELINNYPYITSEVSVIR